ncbi:DUF2971 domain-containing protein [Caballeronia sp. SEWSISQ10-4 2]|uniref:DUF2971 domain-containing protein n=1 Tax=Caballeronia sp. SEWSISQ10-4 2 TaxID=2937438 RepID=UPI0026545206|nr:DUF2971 domain-containing protein [Caballeronia sp. SEWSISQ10-4 2]MDN7176975.1 DUF2971 domain-containing protein [Caballeronia sp. SEWSISQ10-4 2]
MDDRNLLYKYYPPERISVLDEHIVRFTPLHELNDPYEGRFHLEPLERERDAAIADGFRAEWAEVEVFITHRMGALGVLCLSKCPDSELMWAHYASNHSGFVIGIRSDLRPFDGPAHIWWDDPPEIDMTHIPGFGSFRDIKYGFETYQVAYGRQIPFDAFFTKIPDWSYEKEVRIFRSLRDASRIVEKDGAKLHLFEVPNKAFARVIVGSSAPQSVNEAALALARRTDRSQVSVERARIDNRARRILFEPIDGVT